MFIPLNDKLSVAGQLSADDVAEAAAAGFVALINNRPDNETPEQPAGSAIEAAARDCGLGYTHIPVGHGGFQMKQVEAMARALADANGPVLAFCRSGTRSTMLWALAAAHRGEDPDAVAAVAAAAGYDVTPLMQALRQLAGARAAQ